MPTIHPTTAFPGAEVIGAAGVPANGPRVDVERLSTGAARRLTPVRADTASVARGCRPLVGRSKLRFARPPRGAAQRAAR